MYVSLFAKDNQSQASNARSKCVRCVRGGKKTRGNPVSDQKSRQSRCPIEHAAGGHRRSGPAIYLILSERRLTFAVFHQSPPPPLLDPFLSPWLLLRSRGLSEAVIGDSMLLELGAANEEDGKAKWRSIDKRTMKEERRKKRATAIEHNRRRRRRRRRRRKRKRKGKSTAK